MTPEAHERATRIDVLALDVDGVLTDGRIIYSDAGHELQMFHVRDGSGLAMWHRAGKRTAVITGRGSAALERRTAAICISAVLQHVTDKGAALARICGEFAVSPDRVAVVADDLPDLAMLRSAGVRCAVADACREVRDRADYITHAPGGRGAVREIIELLLQAQGNWPAIDGDWLVPRNEE